MSETVLTAGSVKMFGRLLNDILYSYDTSTVTIGGNNFLQNQLSVNAPGPTFTGAIGAAGASQITGVVAKPPSAAFAKGTPVTGPAGVLAPNTVVSSYDNKANTLNIFPPALAAAAAGSSFSSNVVPNFARIYAFAFEGSVYTLPRPGIFLVHGGGLPVDNGSDRTTMDQSGVAAREWEFASAKGQQDLRYWEYHKSDFSLRLEPDSGPLEQILLEAAMRAGADRSERSGAGLEVRSGAGVSGAGVSGAGVSGAGVSGAGLRR